MSSLFSFGDNRFGQLSISNGEEFQNQPYLVEGIDAKTISRIESNSICTFAILDNGLVYNCGCNDNNELCRSGKKSSFRSINILETLTFSEIALGNNFYHLVSRDGKLYSWGRNDLGQLGNGNRENRDKPKVNSIVSDSIIQISSGASHTLALTNNGKVLSWGGNSKGQLGDGQLTSSTIPIHIPLLKNRPVISISCGENHSIVSTISGNIYSWGDNSYGQLGHGDTTSRLRPELIRTLRNTKAKYLSCGKSHTIVLSDLGIPFSFGSNSHGQCGLGSENKIQLFPKVIEALRDRNCVEVSCGALHSLIKVSQLDFEQKTLSIKLYVMGSNSCGQLGLGSRYSNVFEPTYLNLTSPDSQPENSISFIASSPLSLSSYIINGPCLARKKELPAVNLSNIQDIIHQLKILQTNDPYYNNIVNSIREVIYAAFSSISVLNTSFIDSAHISHNHLCINLSSVRESYEMIMSLEKSFPVILSTLGRATLHLVESLKECPFDDAENLSVFFILLENPLMLRTKEFHIVIEAVIKSILSLPKNFRLILFKWFKSYPSEYFGRVIQILQGFLSFAIENKTANLDPTHSVLVLETLFQLNQEERIIPVKSFYNQAVSNKIDLIKEWESWKNMNKSSVVFNYWSYSFLISDEKKHQLLQYEFCYLRTLQGTYHNSKYHVSDILSQAPRPLNLEQLNSFFTLPFGVQTCIEERGLDLVIIFYYRLEIDRDNLLDGLKENLLKVIQTNPATLRLQLKVEFKNEVGMDRGGLAKELFSIAIREIIQKTQILGVNSDGSRYWFTQTNEKISNALDPLVSSQKDYTWEFILGVIVGLAMFNGIYIDLPLPSSIFKIYKQSKLRLSDLWEIDSDLARGLNNLLEYPEGLSAIEDVFGTTFTSSINPILSSTSNEKLKFIELIQDGANTLVTRSNRENFIDCFVNYTLHGCCSEAIRYFFSGFRLVIDDQTLVYCSDEEMESLLCGSRDIGNLSDLRLSTIYKGQFHNDHPIIRWFWEIVSDMTLQEKRRFLSFVTGSERVPVGGISKLNLTIQSTEADARSLPVSHTCFNIIDLSRHYQSKDQLFEKLQIALQHYEGFGLV